MLALIYTGTTGAGHTLAALSLKKALEKAGHQAIIIDAFEENSDLLNRIVSKGYQRLVDYLPYLYKFLYKEFDFESKSTEAVLAQSARLLKEDLLSDIETYNPNLIISTHPIITNILGRLKDKKEFSKPILSFITDYIIHDVYLKDSINAYVVGSEYTKQTMLDRGVNQDIIFPYGIPIRDEFKNNYLKEEDKNSFHILLMAGSLGSRQLKKAFKAIIKANSNLKITVVCGKNEHLKEVVEHISQNVQDNIEVNVIGFTDKISELMESADIIVTKPGGLTSTEAISKNIPIIIPYTYPGQEEENAKYLEESGLAIIVDNIKDLTGLIDDLANNPELIKKMSKAMKNTAESFSIDKTVELCEKLAS